MIFGIYLVVRSKLSISKLRAGLIVLVIFALIIDYLWLENLAKEIVTNRFLFIPAQLNFFYYDFFSRNPKIFWLDSKWLLINKIIGYPYSLDLPFIIGDVYFNRPETQANTGWIGSGYAQAGFWGMMVYALIIGELFKYLDYKALTVGRNFIMISFSPFIVSLFLSADLKTVFLSHGLLLYLIILSVLKSNKGDIRNENC
jgi:hypothetical protein